VTRDRVYIDPFRQTVCFPYFPYYTSTNKEGKETRSYSDALSLELGARYSNRMSEYNRNNKRALGALKSIISLNNNNRFKDKITAEDLY